MSRRVVIAISSLLRPGSEIALRSLAEGLPADIRENVEVIGHSPPQNENAKDVLRDYFPRVDWTFEADPALSGEMLSMCFRLEPVKNNIRNNLLQWYGQLKLAELCAARVADCSLYDCIIWTRPDLLFLLPIRISAFYNSTWIELSPHDHWCGVNDRFMIGHPIVMIRRLRILDYFVNVWYEAMIRNPDEVIGGRFWNPEIVLAHYLRDELQISVRPCYTLFCRLRRINGSFYCILPRLNKYALMASINVADVVGLETERASFENRLRNCADIQKHYGEIADPRRTRILGARAPKDLVPLEIIIEKLYSQRF